jgi:hypothetical protein
MFSLGVEKTSWTPKNTYIVFLIKNEKIFNFRISEILVIKDLAGDPDLDPDRDSPKGLYPDAVSLHPKQCF